MFRTCKNETDVGERICNSLFPQQRERIDRERGILLLLESIQREQRWAVTELPFRSNLAKSIRKDTYDKAWTMSGSSRDTTGGVYASRLMPGYTTRGVTAMERICRLNTPAVNREFTRIVSACSGASHE